MNAINRILFIASSVCVLLACQKEAAKQVNDDKTVLLTINAGTPETKTEISGTTPSWSMGDKISVVYKQDGKSGWYKKASEALASGGSVASFTVSLTTPDATKDAYAYYPNNGITPSTDAVKVTISNTQTPSQNSFDGGSDILISKAFTPSGTVDAQFKRLGAILKISLENATISSEKLANITVEGENNLAGDVQVTLSTTTAEGIVNNGSTSVTATYAPANQFTVSGNYAYLIVYPQTLAKDSHLIISGETSGHSFVKDIVLPSDIVLKPGHIQPLNITLGAGNIAVLPGDALPFDADLDTWVTGSSNTEIALANTNGLFIARSKVYPSAAGELKFGSSSAVGSLTTKYLNLSGPFKVTVSAKYYSSTDKPKIKVTAGEVSKTSTATTNAYDSYEFSFAAGVCSSRETVTIETIDDTDSDATDRRCFINSITIESVLPALSKPTGLSYTGTTLSWSAVENAGSYSVTIGENDKIVNTNSFDFSEFSLPDDYYDATVVAIPSDPLSFQNSPVSDPLEIKVGTPTLSAPSSFVTGTVTANSITVTWTGDAHATKYHCTIAPADAAAQEPTTESVTFSGLTEGESYVITVYAIDGTARYADSAPASTDAIETEEPAGLDPMANGTCFNLTSYNSLPTGWNCSSVDTGSYFKVSANGYMISPAYNIQGYTSAEVSIKVAKYGSGTNPAAVLYVSYDDGATWAESKTLTAPTSSTYLDAQTLSLSKTFTKTVKIKLVNPSGNAALRVQNFSFIATK